MRVRPGIIGEIGTDKPWVIGPGGAGLPGRGRASRATGMAVIDARRDVAGRAAASCEVLEEAGADPGRVVIGHADSYPDLEHWLAIVERGASIEFDFLGMSFTPMERLGEPRVVELLLQMLARGHADRILLSQDVCHNSQLALLRAGTATRTSRRRSCRASRRARGGGGRDPPDHGGEPAADPDDRGVAAGPSPGTPGAEARRAAPPRPAAFAAASRRVTPRASPRRTARRCP